MPTYMLYALGAMLFYGLENSIIDKWLSDVNPLVSVLARSIVAVMILIPMLIRQRTDGVAMPGPQTTAAWNALIVICVLGVLADSLFFGAYTAGKNFSDSGINIGIMIILVPVFIAGWNVVLGGSRPTTQQVIGWAIIALGLWVALNGAPEKPAEEEPTTISP